MAKIIFLGTSASLPSPNRDNTSFIFTYRRETILVDCPGALTYKLIRARIDFTKIKNIIITHHHPDHFYGIIGFLHSQGYLNDQINIFSNLSTIRIIKILVKECNLTERHFPRLHFFNVFSKKFFYNSSHLRLQAIKNKHTKDSFGILFIFGKKRLLYSSDTAISRRIIETAKKCDFLIHECTASSSYFSQHPLLYKMHTDAKSFLRTFAPLPLKKIIPVHFLLLKKREERRIKKELRPLHKKIFFPSDFDELII